MDREEEHHDLPEHLPPPSIAGPRTGAEPRAEPQEFSFPSNALKDHYNKLNKMKFSEPDGPFLLLLHYQVSVCSHTPAPVAVASPWS